MKKIRNILISSVLVAAFAASCSPPLIDPNPSISPIPTPSTGSFSTSTPTPIPTPTPAPGEYRYDIPLILSTSAECSPSDTPKTIYEIKSNGTLSYLTTENGAEVTKEKKLSAADLSSLRDTLQEINLAKLAESDEAVKPGTPQTTECRTIDTFYINVNGKDKTFDRNGRQFIHTKEYFEAVNKLKAKLEDLKEETQTQKYAYSFPLRLTMSNECSGPSGDRVLYEVTSDKNFTYIISENDLSRTSSRKLTESEFTELKDLLKTTDIATLAESDVKIDPNSPQTKECRTIESYSTVVNGASKIYDRNGRQFVHSSLYLEALTKIKNKLVDLSMK